MEQTYSPTVQFYDCLQQAFDHFNVHLFDGKLPPCLITLRSSSRHYGYHHKDRFINSEGKTLDELGLHPGFFTLRSVEESLSTLVHEMVHHWQDRFGHPSRSNPHNKEWAAKMREIGLEPSSTGLPNGKDTGQSVSHFIHPAGRFIASCRELLATGYQLEWFDRHVPKAPEVAQVTNQERKEALAAVGMSVELSIPIAEKLLDALPDDASSSVLVAPPPRKEVDRVKYVCSACGLKAWAGADVSIVCGACEIELRPVDAAST